jgi:hypothetical protein
MQDTEPAPLSAFAAPAAADAATPAPPARWPRLAGLGAALLCAALDSWLGWIWGGPLLLLLLVLAALVHASLGELDWLRQRRGLQRIDAQLRKLRVVRRPPPSPWFAPRWQLEASLAYSVDETARSGAAVLTTVAVLARGYERAAPQRRAAGLAPGRTLALWVDAETPQRAVAARGDVPLHATVGLCAAVAFVALFQIWFGGHFA